MNLEDLRFELRIVSDIARYGVHQKVADRCDINREYLWQIRKGKNVFVDSVENRKLLQKIINTYRSIDREYLRDLEEYEKENLSL